LNFSLYPREDSTARCKFETNRIKFNSKRSCAAQKSATGVLDFGGFPNRLDLVDQGLDFVHVSDDVIVRLSNSTQQSVDALDNGLLDCV